MVDIKDALTTPNLVLVITKVADISAMGSLYALDHYQFEFMRPTSGRHPRNRKLVGLNLIEFQSTQVEGL